MTTKPIVAAATLERFREKKSPARRGLDSRNPRVRGITAFDPLSPRICAV